MTIFAAMAEKQKRKKIGRNLRNKFRLVVMNDETLEERFALRLSPMNVIVVSGTIMLALIFITLYLIAFTPLREYIPGYTDVNMRRNIVMLTLKADSMERQMQAANMFLDNYRNVLRDSVTVAPTDTGSIKTALFDSIHHLHRSEDDSLLRLLVENQDQFNLSSTDAKSFSSGIGSYYFFTPVKGTIITPFSTVKKHFGVDIVAAPDEVIKCAMDGTVILANWTSETGYVMGVQHSNNLLTLYKHNSALLKNVGDYVKAGEAIAIIGNTGEYTSGPHLHFELWYNSSPVNPVDYISF